MSLLEQHFYHSTITLYTKVFGAIFNNMKIKRGNNQMIAVPISYFSGQKYNVINQQRPDVDEVKFKQRVPRMTYEMTDFTRDVTRSKSKQFRITSELAEGDTGVRSQYNRVPYKFNFRLDARTAYLDDMLQLIEQICVSFDPSIQVKVRDNPDLDGVSALNITLLSAVLQDDVEGSFEQQRDIQATFTFELDGYLYRRTSDVGLINKVTIEYLDLETQQLLETDVFLAPTE